MRLPDPGCEGRPSPPQNPMAVHGNGRVAQYGHVNEYGQVLFGRTNRVPIPETIGSTRQKLPIQQTSSPSLNPVDSV